MKQFMNNANLPALPADIDTQTFGEVFGSCSLKDLTQYRSGLTKREMFAMAAMQGLLNSSHPYKSRQSVAEESVRLADALLTELDNGNN